MVIKLKRHMTTVFGLGLVLLGIIFLVYSVLFMDSDRRLWQDMPSSVAPVASVDPKKPMVALTFDDGPYAPSTCRILDALEKVQGKATFFVVGDRVKGREDTLLKIRNSGCEIGNHTYNHVCIRGLSDAQLQQQLQKGDAAIRAVTGENPTLVRPPGGAYSKNLRKLEKRPIVLWSIDTMDWSHQNPQKTIQKVLKNVKDGDIILMHDLFVPTAEAAEVLIPELHKRGYQLVTVSELLENREKVEAVI